jgi:hypothetical protein
VLLCRLYTVLKNSWTLERKIHYLGWLYSYYLRNCKPLIVAKTGPGGGKDRDKAALHIKHCYDTWKAIIDIGVGDNDEKKALFDEAQAANELKILGSSPLDVPMDVKSAIASLSTLTARMQAIGPLTNCYLIVIVNYLIHYVVGSYISSY